MSGRKTPNYLPPHHLHPTLTDETRNILRREVQAHGRAHPTTEIEAREREIQALLHDNQKLAATHVSLKRELAAADQEFRHLSSTAATVKTESEARVQEVYENSLIAEAELRSLDEKAVDLAQVNVDIEKMTADRKEFTVKLREVNEELVMVRTELEQLPAVESEIADMNKEIQKGRAAIEYEKKMQAKNLEQSQIMEKHITSMAHEVEKLRAELADVENRARAAAAAAAAAGTGYVGGYAYPEAGYGGALYSGHYPMPQVVDDENLQYGAAGGLPHGPIGPYDVQHPNLPG